MVIAGVDAAVVIAPGWDPDEGEAHLAVSRYPDRFGRAVRVSVDDPVRGSWVASWRPGDDVVALRASFWPIESRQWITDGTADWLWRAAAHSRIPVMCFAPHAIQAIGSIAQRHPDLRVAIDHMGLSVEVRGRSRGEAIRQLIGLARYPNVVVKASALPDYAIDHYPFASLHADVRRVVDAFGPTRVFWGSDLTRLSCTYREAIDLFREALDLSSDDRSLILGEGIAAWLGWPRRTSVPPSATSVATRRPEATRLS
jgi:predicted TIM-barrel fold metal-dependent hydrolase